VFHSLEAAFAENIEDATSLNSLKSILELKVDMPGTKIQVKPQYNKVDKSLERAQLIVKWGGEFTHAGSHQSKDLGKNLRFGRIHM
jgi:inositol-hexakisphosphate/diphosphoinositol-pentakisphosphate 1-kinase